MKKNSKIYVAGHNGLVGSALVRLLKKKGYQNLIAKSRRELDLTDRQAAADFFKKEKPEYVFLAAAKVGGIMANKTYPAEFIYDNLQIQNNIVHQSYLSKVKKLLFLGSVCIYPKLCPTPVKEEYLLSGLLEPTNEPYAIAKIAGLKMCQSYNSQYKTDFIAVMPANLYGHNDNFDLNNSHVLPAMIRKFHEAKINEQREIILWGSGKPRREFLFIDDMAEACLFAMNEFDPTAEQNEKGEIFFNIGAGSDIPIKDLAELVKETVGFKGKIKWDETKPDGAPKRLLDISKALNLGWKPKTELAKGVKMTYDWYVSNYSQTIA
ncbi:MAG: GDP-L-fucose synthase [Patescibacteria group bacterium]|nr:GDP-L-fucose synthase [Patescibacteria group bacterium]MDE1988311.1 GDP-L-fucose synthase [Patescibacteria group bacterium]MDE2218324.1 GDP-L-fucose synthase [Patescibacteria group bacterium]